MTKFVEDSSTNPIGFFEYFYQLKGFTVYHNKFKPSRDEMERYDMSYDPQLEMRSGVAYDEEQETDAFYKIYFHEELKRHLVLEYYKAIPLINLKVLNCHSRTQQITLLQSLINEIEYLHVVLTKYVEASKYEDNAKVLSALTKYIKEKYKDLIVEKSEVSGDSLQEDVAIAEPTTLEELFNVNEWRIYISALEKTEPPLLSSGWEFIGNPHKHKGVIASWIKDLQLKHIIKPLNRSKVVSILNNEFKKFNMGVDGKTIDNRSNEYETIFKQQLLKLTKLP